MRVELRLVKEAFWGRHLARKNKSRLEQFSDGDQLIVYENDGTRTYFVRLEDVRKKFPFVAHTSDIERSTELYGSRTLNAKRYEFEFAPRPQQYPGDQKLSPIIDEMRIKHEAYNLDPAIKHRSLGRLGRVDRR